MARLLFVVLAGCAALSLCTSKPTGDDNPQATEHLRFRPTHTPESDHEAFLGKEEAERFDQLSPEEAQRRLGIIVGKIDKDKNGFVTEIELEEWVRHVSSRYIYDDAQRQWEYHEKDGDDRITLEEYHKGAYGEVEDPEEIYDHHRRLTFKQMMERDQKRFSAADGDNDGKLTKDEFAMFLHPEESAHLRPIIVDETMQDMDKNKDGFVTVDEYINDLWPAYERQEDEPEPNWVQSEREQFSTHRDKDADGRLSKEEVAQWVMPDGFDHAKAEAAHLVYEADVDKDKQLTMQEILDHHDLFVGSQATDFGEYLVRHDEF